MKNETQIPLDGVFAVDERIEGKEFKIDFYWTPVDSLGQIEVYPTNIADLMERYDEGVQHFVYREGMKKPKSGNIQ